jgi:glycosyltransferase involved in cell wall biosynthesis
MKITVYTICWNEIFLLPHFFKHYDWADKIVVYDNGSDDGSQEFVTSHPKGELRYYDTNLQQDNIQMAKTKNECWKGDDSDWVVVVDVDEFLIGHEKLREYEGQTLIFKCRGWQMVSEYVPTDFTVITAKYPDWCLHKCACFSPKIDGIRYEPGCHRCFPRPRGLVVDNVLDLYHYNALSEEYMVQRWKRYVERMSDVDLQNNYGKHYLWQEQRIREEFRNRLVLAKG